MFSCFFAIFDLKIRMQYFQYFQGLKNENKQMWFASNKEVRRRIEIEALILMTKLLFAGLISVTIIAFALIIALVVIISKQK